MKKVICIGDSIRMGYEPTVVAELKGWAQVNEMGSVQGGNTRNVLQHLNEWVIQHQPDIVHLNAGLHDMAREPGPGPENQVPLAEYGTNLTQILTNLRQQTEAALIFALTTPVDLNRQFAVQKAVNRTPEDVATYNQAAIAVASNLDVTINDLHAAVMEAGTADLLAEDGVHFTPEGSEFLGRTAAVSIRANAP